MEHNGLSIDGVNMKEMLNQNVTVESHLKDG